MIYLSRSFSVIINYNFNLFPLLNLLWHFLLASVAELVDGICRRARLTSIFEVKLNAEVRIKGRIHCYFVRVHGASLQNIRLLSWLDEACVNGKAAD